MRRSFFLISAIALLSLFFVYWYVCECHDNSCDHILSENRIGQLFTGFSMPSFFSKKTVDETADIPEKNSVVSVPQLTIEDGEGITLYIEKENLRFARYQSEPVIGDSVINVLAKLKQYLEVNPVRKLVVTGYSHNLEHKNADTGLEDVGLARAEAIKQKLVNSGVPDNQIDLKSSIDSTLIFYQDTLYGGITFAFDVMEIEAEVAKDLMDVARKIYFQTGTSEIDMTPELVEYFRNVKIFLNQDARRNLLLTGHTDSQGTQADNLKLGKKRGEEVKWQLVKMGIDADRMRVASKGEDVPIAENLYEAGRSKNRRVEIITR